MCIIVAISSYCWNESLTYHLLCVGRLPASLKWFNCWTTREQLNEGACLQTLLTTTCFSTFYINVFTHTCAHTHTKPYNVVVNCGAPESPAQGATEYSLTEYGAKAKYLCNTGYVLSGAESTVCTLDGTWNLPPPTCNSKLTIYYISYMLVKDNIG